MPTYKILEGNKFIADADSPSALDALHEVMVDCAGRNEKREYRLFRVDGDIINASDVWDSFGFTGYECLCEIVADGSELHNYDVYSMSWTKNNADVLSEAYAAFENNVENAKKLVRENRCYENMTVYLWESMSVDDATNYELVERYVATENEDFGQ